MACWLYIVDRDNWEVVKKENIIGIPPRNKKMASRIKPGDRVVVYIKQQVTKDEALPPQIGGVFKVVSEVYRDTKRIFKRMTLPYRLKLEPVLVPKEPKDFKPIVRKLEFVKKKKRWSGYLAGRIVRKIPETDCEIIEEYLKS